MFLFYLSLSFFFLQPCIPFWKLKLFLLPMMELITKQLIDTVIHERFWSPLGWWNFKFLLFFFRVTARAITENLVAASICPGRWGRLTFFHFFASRGFWWSTVNVLVPVDAGESDLHCRHYTQCWHPCVWVLMQPVCGGGVCSCWGLETFLQGVRDTGCCFFGLRGGNITLL